MGNIWTVIHKYLDRLSVPGNGNRFQRYGFVFVISIIFFLLKETLVTTLGIEAPFLFSLLVVVISAWFGGFGPGILATLLSGSIAYYFYLAPRYTLFGEENIPNAIVIVLFFLEGFFISMMSESHRRSDIQKSEFIGVISHELKNPLTTIKGYAEIIQRMASKKGENKLAEFGIRIDQQIKNVIEMINEMLDITKIETGRLTYHDETFNIFDLAKEIVGDQQVTTDIHKIHFFGRGDKYITGDRYRIGQVITNLISNAIKYSPNAKIINVKVEQKRTGIVVSVQDFGPGISKENQQKLFELFFRAKNAGSAKGTGIGLFISNQIVKRHKMGGLWWKVQLAKGQHFIYIYPLKRYYRIVFVTLCLKLNEYMKMQKQMMGSEY